MGEISISALLLRFILGGAAVVLCTIVSKKMGTKIGGIFAAFPAVYLAAILTVGLDFSGDQLVAKSILLSKGAIVGMLINIAVAVAAGYFITKQGGKRGLTNAMGVWLVLSVLVVVITA